MAQEALDDLEALACLRVVPIRFEGEGVLLKSTSDFAYDGIRQVGDALRLLRDIAEKTEGSDRLGNVLAEVGALRAEVRRLKASIAAMLSAPRSLPGGLECKEGHGSPQEERLRVCGSSADPGRKKEEGAWGISIGFPTETSSGGGGSPCSTPPFGGVEEGLAAQAS